MTITVECGECGKALRVNDKYAGKRIRCPDCEEPISVPAVPTRKQRQADEWAETEAPSRRVTRAPARQKKRTSRSKKKQSAHRLHPAVLWSVIGGVVVSGGVVAAIVLLRSSDPVVIANVENDATTVENGSSGASQSSVSSTDPVSRIDNGQSTAELTTGAGKTDTEPAAELPLADLIERIDDGVVLISVKDTSGRDLGFGTGFVVDKTGRVATNFHVLEGGARATAQFRDGERVDVVGFWAWDEKRDLAIVQLASLPQNAEVLKLGSPTVP
jgi:DNA-directed RNA polymerase subunit RPC12/RpoP